MIHSPRLALVVGALSFVLPTGALTSLDLSTLPNGTVISGPIQGVTITVDNPYPDGWDRARVFSYTKNPRAAAGGHQTPWLGGNVDPNDDLGQGLVLAGLPGKFFETRSKPGSFTLAFDKPITMLGFAVVDHETISEGDTSTGYFVQLFSNGKQVAGLSYNDFITRGSAVYDPTITYGDQTANRFGPLTAAAFNVESFDAATIALGGSGGIADIRFEPIPTPTAVLAGLTGLSIMIMRRRRN